MSKQKIHTSMLGRHVQLGWSVEQLTEWGRQNPNQTCDVAVVPATYAKYGQETGEIVNVYIEDNTPLYDVLMGDGSICVGLCAKHNFIKVFNDMR